MAEECTSNVLNNTFTNVNSQEAKHLQVKPTGDKWVYKMKHNRDGTIWYKAHLVIKLSDQMDFGETYALVGKRTASRYLISKIGNHGWNTQHSDVVTPFLSLEIYEDDIYMTVAECWPSGPNVPTIVVQLRKALYGLKRAPRRCHNDINT